MKMSEEAARLESELNETAKQLGLKLRVTYDAFDFCLRFDAALALDRVWHAVDEHVLVRQPSGSRALADLLMDVLENLQLRLHDQTAAAMQKRDVRERIFRLSKEDKALLHDLCTDACSHRMRDFNRAEENQKKVDEYQALMGRLFR